MRRAPEKPDSGYRVGMWDRNMLSGSNLFTSSSGSGAGLQFRILNILLISTAETNGVLTAVCDCTEGKYY